MRVQYDVMVQEFARVLEKKGFTHEDAENAAIIFAQNSLAGVYSHGLNRFPRVVSYLEKGEIDPNARATCEMKMGAIERWDGHRGFGPLNAKRAMDRACELAKENGIGCVALGNFIDRVIRNYVVDFIYFKPINFPIFNFADICVTVGTFLLFLCLIFVYKENELEFYKK